MVARCPFCKGQISNDLARFGGNCPHCLLEVPGDEAPTDPGLVARNRQAEEDRKAALVRRRRRIIAGVSSSLFLGLAVVIGIWRYQVYLESLVYELPEYYQRSLEELEAAAAQEAEAEKAEAAKVAEAKARNTKKPSTNNGTAGSAGGTTGGTTGETGTKSPPVAAAPENGTAEVPMSGTGGPSISTGGGITLSAKDVGILSSDDEIRAMAAKAISVYSRQIDTCYINRAKQNPRFNGAWKLTLTITKEGTVEDVAVVALSTKDSEMQACIERNAAQWKFQRIAHDQRVSRTFRYEGEG